MNSYMNSYIWIHNILHDHKFISEFIWWIHIRFHDHQFICDISWPMNSYMNSCIWRISWNHTWIHVYQGSRWLHWACTTNARKCEKISFCLGHTNVRNVFSPFLKGQSGGWGMETTHSLPQFGHLQLTKTEFKLVSVPAGCCPAGRIGCLL